MPTVVGMVTAFSLEKPIVSANCIDLRSFFCYAHVIAVSTGFLSGYCRTGSVKRIVFCYRLPSRTTKRTKSVSLVTNSGNFDDF